MVISDQFTRSACLHLKAFPLLLLLMLSFFAAGCAASLQEKDVLSDNLQWSVVDVDVGSFLPVVYNDGKKMIFTERKLEERYENDKKVEAALQLIKNGNEDEAIILLAAAWKVLPPKKASEIMRSLPDERFIDDNVFIAFYKALFLASGYCLDADFSKSLRLLEKAFFEECMAAGIGIFDIMDSTSIGFSAKEYERWLVNIKDPKNPHFSARIGWAKVRGAWTEKDERAGWNMIRNAASEGVPFAHFKIGIDAELMKGNYDLARESYSRAVSRENLEAAVRLADILDENNEHERRTYLYYFAAKRMSVHGMRGLANVFEKENNYTDSLMVSTLLYYTLLEWEEKGFRSFKEKDSVEKQIDVLAGRLYEDSALNLELKKLENILKEMSIMFEGKYYFNQRLEDRATKRGH